MSASKSTQHVVMPNNNSICYIKKHTVLTRPRLRFAINEKEYVRSTYLCGYMYIHYDRYTTYKYYTVHRIPPCIRYYDMYNTRVSCL